MERRGGFPARCAVVGVAGLVLGLCVAGCGTSPGRTEPTHRAARSRGDTWEAVLPGAPVFALGETNRVRAFDTRRDRALNLTHAEARTALDAWPENPRPCLTRPRVVRVSPHDHGFYIYRSERREETIYRSWSGW